MQNHTAASPVSACTRRDFVSRLAATAAALPLAGAVSAAVAAEKKSSAPAAMAKPAAGPSTIHVFSKPLHMYPAAEAARIIAECGYGGVDFTVRTQQPHVLPAKAADDLPRAIDAARAAGLKVEMITTEITSVRGAHAETVLRAAAKHGVKCYRLGNFTYDAKLGILGTLEKLQPQLQELAALNRSLGLHGAIQNHSGTRVGSPVWDLHHLLKDLDPRWLGVQYDIRHATNEGGLSWPLALKLLAPWIRCTDIKDFKWLQAPGKGSVENTPLGEGIVPFAAYFKQVRELGVGGPISVHLEYPPFERAPASLSAAERLARMKALMKQDLAFLRGQLAQAGLA